MTTLLLFLALLLIIVGGVMLLVVTFRVNIWWGIASLIFAPIQIVFVFKYWEESRNSIWVQTAGLVLLVLALMMGGNQFTDAYRQQIDDAIQQYSNEQTL